MAISRWIASFFGIIIKLIYNLVGRSYGVSILIFTVITKLILFPITYKQSKAMENMKKVAPLEKEIREKYKGNKEKTSEELAKMYSEHKINPLGSCLPLIIQIPMILAMFYIVRQPLTYISDMSTDEIKVYMEETMVVGGKTIYKEDYTETQIKNQEIKIAKEKQIINMNFLGLNLGDIPQDAVINNKDISNKPSKITLLVPILSLLFAILQNKMSQKRSSMTEEQKQQQKTMNLMMPVLSAYISFIMPVALGIYWLFGNILQILSQLIIDKMLGKKEKEKMLNEGEK